MKKAKSAANFFGKEKDPKLSGFDWFTSMAGNLELRSFSRFIELMLVISPYTAKVERSFSLMNSREGIPSSFPLVAVIPSNSQTNF